MSNEDAPKTALGQKLRIELSQKLRIEICDAVATVLNLVGGRRATCHVVEDEVGVVLWCESPTSPVSSWGTRVAHVALRGDGMWAHVSGEAYFDRVCALIAEHVVRHVWPSGKRTDAGQTPDNPFYDTQLGIPYPFDDVHLSVKDAAPKEAQEENSRTVRFGIPCLFNAVPLDHFDGEHPTLKEARGLNEGGVGAELRGEPSDALKSATPDVVYGAYVALRTEQAVDKTALSALRAEKTALEAKVAQQAKSIAELQEIIDRGDEEETRLEALNTDLEAQAAKSRQLARLLCGADAGLNEAFEWARSFTQRDRFILGKDSSIREYIASMEKSHAEQRAQIEGVAQGNQPSELEKLRTQVQELAAIVCGPGATYDTAVAWKRRHLDPAGDISASHVYREQLAYIERMRKQHPVSGQSEPIAENRELMLKAAMSSPGLIIVDKSASEDAKKLEELLTLLIGPCATLDTALSWAHDKRAASLDRSILHYVESLESFAASDPSSRLTECVRYLSDIAAELNFENITPETFGYLSGLVGTLRTRCSAVEHALSDLRSTLRSILDS